MSAPAIAATLIGFLVATIAVLGVGLAVYDRLSRRAEGRFTPPAESRAGSPRSEAEPFGPTPAPAPKDQPSAKCSVHGPMMVP